MKRAILSGLAILMLAGLTAVAIGAGSDSKSKSTTPTAAGSDAKNTASQTSRTYEVEPTHVSVYFRIKHLSTSYTYGRFNNVSGAWTLADETGRNQFEFTLATDSIDTGNDKRDGHLKSPDFFNVKQFPAIHFKSTRVQSQGDRLHVTGDLTMHGVTQSVSFDLTVMDEIEHAMFGKRCGLDAAFTIKRSDFGMTKFVSEGVVGDDVMLMISLEGLRKG